MRFMVTELSLAEVSLEAIDATGDRQEADIDSRCLGLTSSSVVLGGPIINKDHFD